MLVLRNKTFDFIVIQYIRLILGAKSLDIILLALILPAERYFVL